MFIFEHPERVLVASIAMMLFGCVMPFLMAIHVVESTFFLNFLSFGMSTLGLFLGVAAVAFLRVKQRKNKDDEDRYR
ncbi:MAG TPA: hypothetical protein PK078_00525 [Anaerolineales bacterium]|nr:hypothetical protein [Anaerolineales bacterium]HNB35322.1 hypothetical protein [Anaerolineales bacterium]HNC08730.1 hypothetical protein [Anaerolineales bacterium]